MILFEWAFDEAPTNTGIEAPALVQQHPDETRGVEYPTPSCRRLLE